MTYILITGNIRSGTEFAWMVQRCLELRAEGRVDEVLWSTWKGEIDRFPGLGKELAQTALRIVESDPPEITPTLDPRANGNIFFQKKALAMGLHHIPDDAFVIKTRTDKAQERFESCLAALGERLLSPPSESLHPQLDVFSRRLFTYDVRPDYLFYFDDIVYCGVCRDLRKMMAMDSGFDVMFPRNRFPAEVRFLGLSFIERCGVFRDFYLMIDQKAFCEVMWRWARYDGNELPLPGGILRLLGVYLAMLHHQLLLPAQPADAGNGSMSGTLRNVFLRDEVLGTIEFGNPWPSIKMTHSKALMALYKDSGLEGDNADAVRDVRRRLLGGETTVTGGFTSEELDEMENFAGQHRVPWGMMPKVNVREGGGERVPENLQALVAVEPPVSGRARRHHVWALRKERLKRAWGYLHTGV